MMPAAGRPGPTVSLRELHLLQAFADGLSYDEIARRQSLPSGTVRRHAFDLRNRLGARSQAHLVAIGYRRGLLTDTSTTTEAAAGKDGG